MRIGKLVLQIHTRRTVEHKRKELFWQWGYTKDRWPKGPLEGRIPLTPWWRYSHA